MLSVYRESSIQTLRVRNRLRADEGWASNALLKHATCGSASDNISGILMNRPQNPRRTSQDSGFVEVRKSYTTNLDAEMTTNDGARAGDADFATRQHATVRLAVHPATAAAASTHVQTRSRCHISDTITVQMFGTRVIDANSCDAKASDKCWMMARGNSQPSKRQAVVQGNFGNLQQRISRQWSFNATCS